MMKLGIHTLALVLVFASGLWVGKRIRAEEGSSVPVASEQDSERGLSEKQISLVKSSLLEMSEKESILKLRREGDARAHPWFDTLRSADSSKYQQVYAEIESALASSDLVAIHGALSVIRQVGSRRLDWSPLRPLVESHLEGKNPEIRLAAWKALAVTGVQSGDLERLYELKGESYFIPNMTTLLALFNGKDFTGESGKIVSDLIMQTFEHLPRDRLISPLQRRGTKMSEELQDTLLEMMASPNVFHSQHALFAIRSYAPGSPKIMREVLNMVRGPFSNNAASALSVLETGLPEEMKPEVADAALRTIEQRKNGRARSSAFRLLHYCGREHLRSLEKALENSTLSDEERSWLLERRGQLSQLSE